MTARDIALEEKEQQIVTIIDKELERKRKNDEGLKRKKEEDERRRREENDFLMKREEEIRKKEEERKRMEEEDMRKRIEEEKRKKEEEDIRMRIEEELKRKRMEEERIRQLEERQKRDDLDTLLVGLRISTNTKDVLVEHEILTAAALMTASVDDLKQLGIKAGQALEIKSRFHLPHPLHGGAAVCRFAHVKFYVPVLFSYRSLIISFLFSLFVFLLCFV